MAAFDSLHEKVRRWIWQQGWEGLHDVQERAIPILLEGTHDLVLMAPTAGGKTEAAFLPIVSRLASDPPPAGDGFQVIYVSPMRALINDQFGRMESLCAELDISVTKWHGDISASVKARARRQPHGIVLITPESLEALLVRRGKEVARLFRGLRYVVVDEMHVFLGDPRGKQLQSVLHRIDLAARVQPVRVGLSATLADEESARVFLRPLEPARVTVLPPTPGGPQVKLQLRGYVRPSRFRPSGAEQQEEKPGTQALMRHLFETHRQHRSLIFAGSRGRVEEVTVALSDMTKAAGLPEVFFAHHGNLSREQREYAEKRMKDPSRPATIVCTTTLELGIDVGNIEAVAQLGPGRTVSGMRQRLGRSGRRSGQDAVMRVYVQEAELDEKTHPLDALRVQTVQAIAMINLMLRRWNEPPEPERLHLSTLLHQIMALVGERGGVTATDAWNILVRGGVFTGVDVPLFTKLLRRMGDPKVGLLEQTADGTLLPGPDGERLLESRDIYAVFLNQEEYRVVAEEGRTIGQIPATFPFTVDQTIILGGRRWRIVAVNVERHELTVRPASGGKPPVFGGEAPTPADGVVREMCRVWEDLSFPCYLDAEARNLLIEARTAYDTLGLRHRQIVQREGRLLLFPWVGARKLRTLICVLMRADLAPEPLGVAIGVASEKAAPLRAALSSLAAPPAPAAEELAQAATDKEVEKFDGFLGDKLLTLAWARDQLDVASLPDLAAALLKSWPH